MTPAVTDKLPTVRTSSTGHKAYLESGKSRRTQGHPEARRRDRKASWDKAKLITQRDEAQEDNDCSVSGCTKPRRGVSDLCNKHAVRLYRNGDPIATPISPQVLRLYRTALDAWVELLSERQKAIVVGSIETGARRLLVPGNWAMRPQEWRQGLTQSAKADIIRANFQKQHGLEDIKEALWDAVSIVGYGHGPLFDGLREYRDRWINASIGKHIKRQTKFTLETITKLPFGTGEFIQTAEGPEEVMVIRPVRKIIAPKAGASVLANLGSKYREQAFDAFGPNPFNQTVTSTDGMSMSLQGFIEIALRKAGYLQSSHQ